MTNTKTMNENGTTETLQVKKKLAFGQTAICAELDPHELGLFDWTLLEEMPEGDPWDSIKDLYTSKNFREKALACLLNGVFTCRKAEFILSRDLLEKYLVADPNMNRKYVNGEQMGKLMDHWLAVNSEASILKCIKASVPLFKSGGNKSETTKNEKLKAATYQVVWAPIVQFFTWPQASTANSTWMNTPIMLCDVKSHCGMSCYVSSNNEDETNVIKIKASPYHKFNHNLRVEWEAQRDSVSNDWFNDKRLPDDWYKSDYGEHFKTTELEKLVELNKCNNDHGRSPDEGYMIMSSLIADYVEWKLGNVRSRFFAK